MHDEHVYLGLAPEGTAGDFHSTGAELDRPEMGEYLAGEPLSHDDLRIDGEYEFADESDYIDGEE